jgi:unsaturated chondroitin disaccharide hydrolase
MTQENLPPDQHETHSFFVHGRKKIIAATAALAVAASAATYTLRSASSERAGGDQTTEQSENHAENFEVSQQQVDEVFKRAKDKSHHTDRRLDYLGAQNDRENLPYLIGGNGQWETTPSFGWTSGFYPGIKWQIAKHNKLTTHKQNPSDSSDAYGWTIGLEKQKTNDSSHDLGFRMMPSFGQAYEQMTSFKEQQKSKEILLTAAETLASRYDPKVGAIRSWGKKTDNDFKVIIDNMMNLELLFWAEKHGGKKELGDIARQHAETTMKNHVREDGSVYQLVDFNKNNGQVRSKGNYQAYNNESVWSRGQAWAIGGFAIAYRETGEHAFLETARKSADYFIDNLPEDSVPYWDFKSPNIPNEPRDSSAAAIAASSLLELSQLETEPAKQEKYFNAATSILRSLMSTQYSSIESEAILKHGTHNKPKGEGVDVGIVYGDYYFLKALNQYTELRTHN